MNLVMILHDFFYHDPRHILIRDTSKQLLTRCVIAFFTNPTKRKQTNNNNVLKYNINKNVQNLTHSTNITISILKYPSLFGQLDFTATSLALLSVCHLFLIIISKHNYFPDNQFSLSVHQCQFVCLSLCLYPSVVPSVSPPCLPPMTHLCRLPSPPGTCLPPSSREL